MSHDAPHASRVLVFIAVLAVVLFLPLLGGIPLFDWDEVNFAEIAREMIETGDYLRVSIDYQPFYEKPPMFFWMQAISMHLWGINEFAARFPNAVCGLVTLCCLYLMGRRQHDHRFGLLWVIAYAGSILPHLYFRSGIIDPWFNLFIFLSLYVLYVRADLPVIKRVMVSGVLLGFALLTKGPVALLIAGLVYVVYVMTKKQRQVVSLRDMVLYALTGLLVFGIWAGVESLRNGPEFIIAFTRYQFDLLIRPGAGHSGFPGYHIVVLLLGCFPASILAISELSGKGKTETDTQRVFLRMMVILFWVVLILFSLVRSKIVHYSSLCYFPITFLATRYVWILLREGKAIGAARQWGIVSLGVLYFIAGTVLVLCGLNPEWLLRTVTLDADTVASLTIDPGWQWGHLLPVVFLMAGSVWFFIWRHTRKQTAIITLYTSVMVFVITGLMLWTGKIQRYSQGPATAFFTSLRGQDVYVVPWGYKSYAQYWEFRKPFPQHVETDMESSYRRYSDPHYLLTSDEIDRDVYIVTKVSKMAGFEAAYPEAERIGEEGAFVFYRRRYNPDE